MRGSLRLVPDLQAIHSRRHFPALHPASNSVAALSQLRPSALGRPSSALVGPTVRVRALSSRGRGSGQAQWQAAGGRCLHAPSRLLAWKGAGRWGPGQIRLRHDERLMRLDELLGDRVDGALQQEVRELGPGNEISWQDAFMTMQRRHGTDGIWACLHALSLGAQLGMLARDESEHLRDEIVRAASLKESRIAGLIEVARTLLAVEDFRWPDLYVKIMHLLLEEADFEAAVRWHLQLMPLFPPAPDVFGALLASFVTDADPKMQRALTTLYISSVERSLYDHLLPALFRSGQSRLARSWRTMLNLFGDHPSQSRSRPFLRFLRAYYPSLDFTEQELAMIRCEAPGLVTSGGHASNNENSGPEGTGSDAPKGIHSDALVAKLFASTWTSVEFAINVAHRLGVRIIGPRSLQSLALRERDPEDVVARLSQLEEMGIQVSPKIYCRTLITFAKTGKSELLSALLHCDIHPDEFEALETRRALLAEAINRGNEAMRRLLQGVEWAIVSGPTSRRLNSLLSNMLARRGLARPRALIDRMGAVGIHMTQTSASELLRRAFGNLSPRPYHRITEEDPYDPLLDRAIDMVRRIGQHDVAIPIHYWRVVLFSLGRSRRLSQLEQLSLDVLRYYTPLYGGLIPVHADDLPASWTGRGEKEYIPADLPLSHHEHPLRRIFDSKLQRGIVRWAFDQTLAREPSLPALMMDGGGGGKKSVAAYAEYDIARGVRLLAHLRDQGVLIDRQVLRSSILSCIALGRIPGRGRNRARDSNELTVRGVKELVEEAWGREIFASVEDLNRRLDASKTRLWKHYPKLCATAYG